ATAAARARSDHTAESIMRWGPFWLALLLVAAAQTTFVYIFDWRWLHLPLALALLCGLNAPTHDARIAAWLAGFAQELCTESSTLGLFAFSFGFGVLLLTYLRDRLNPGAWWMRWLLAAIGGWAGLEFVELAARWWLGVPSAGAWAIWMGPL